MDDIEEALRQFASAVAFDATHGGEDEDTGENVAADDVTRSIQHLLTAIDARISAKVADAISQRSR